jgi:hypothetical protein
MIIPIAAKIAIIKPVIKIEDGWLGGSGASGGTGVGAASVWKLNVADQSLGAGSSAITRQK